MRFITLEFMAKSAAKAFHHTVTRLFNVALLLFILTGAAAFFVYYQLLNNNIALVEHRLPELQKQQQIRGLLLQAQLQLRTIVNAAQARDFSERHQQLAEQWQRLAFLTNPHNQWFNELVYQQKQTAQQAQRLSQNSERNNQLKQDSVIELELILSSLQQVLNKQQAQQQLLLEQIVSDNVSDRVTAARARAHANSVNALLYYRQLNDQLNDVMQRLKSLDLNSDEAKFDALEQSAEQTFSEFQQHKSSMQGDADTEELLGQLDTFEQLLFSKQALLAKWRGHLRLTQQYRQPLVLVQEKIQSMLTDGSAPADAQVPQQVNSQGVAAVLASWYGKISPRQWQWLLLTWLLLALTGLLLLLWSLQRKMTAYRQLTQALVKQQLSATDGSVATVVPLYREQDEILAQIRQIQRPKHGEQDYQQLLAERQRQLDLLAQWQKVALWRLVVGSQDVASNALARKLLGQDKATAGNAGWRHYFSRSEAKLLLAAARTARTSAQPQLLAVNSRYGNTVILSLHYLQGQWHGSIADYQQIDKLYQQLQETQRLSDEQLQQIRQQVVSQQRQLQQLLVQAHLQLQRASLQQGGENMAPMSRRLWRVADCIHQQQQLFARLQLQAPLQLQDCALDNLLHSAVCNAQMQVAGQKNQLFLDYERQIVANVKTDAGILERLLSDLAVAMLADHCDSQLLLDVTLQDKNSGQQLLRFNMSCQGNERQISAPEMLRQLPAQQASDDDAPLLSRYLSCQLQALNVRQLEFSADEQGYQLQFLLPVALAQTQPEPQQAPNLKEARVMLLSRDKLLQRLLSHALSSANARFDAIADVQLFCRQHDVKHLSKKPLPLLITAFAAGSHDHSLLHEHLQRLPPHCRPKLLQLQIDSGAAMSRQGFYRHSLTPLLLPPLIQDMPQLLRGDASSNLLFDPVLCQQYQRRAAQVELLLASGALVRHQPLIRLLRWLGFRVSVTAEQQCMNTLWRSGRYLLLLTAMPGQPEMQFAAAGQVKRGIFLLAPAVEQLAAWQARVATPHCSIEPLQDISELAALVEQLMPWLAAETRVEPLLDNGMPANDELLEQSPGKVVASSRRIKSAAMHSAAETDEELDHQAFDLQQFALNQGSAEMAAFMLSDYIDSLHSDAEALQSAYSDKDVSRADAVVAQLLLTAKILAAPALVDSLQRLMALQADGEPAQLQAVLDELAYEIAQLASFAEAI